MLAGLDYSDIFGRTLGLANILLVPSYSALALLLIIV
jgi:hypothetical protein